MTDKGDSEDLRQDKELYRAMIENAPLGVFRATLEGEIRYANEALTDMLGYGSQDEMLEDEAPRYEDPEDREEFFNALREHGTVDTLDTRIQTADGETRDVMLSGKALDDTAAGFVVDISEQKRLQRKARKQAEAILELSIPVVQVWDDVILATIVGTLDSQRAQRLTERLLQQIVETESSVALIDITGVPTIDTATAQHLLDSINAVNLLGAEVVITGINPEIAQTLVRLGIDLSTIETKASLSEGLKLALEITDAELEKH